MYPFTTHDLAELLTRPGAAVLDLGSGPGVVAQRLRRLGCEVVGLDSDEKAVEAMRAEGFEAYRCDLDVDDLVDVVGARRFDVVVCLDVLEHLRRPEEVLRRIADVLREPGEILISLPNVTHADVRLSLLAGRFRYADSGPLDRTHLRFFDRDGVRELLASSGMRQVELFAIQRPVAETEVGPTPGVPGEARDFVLTDPDATVYQWFLRVAPGEQGADDPPLAWFVRDLLARHEALEESSRYVEHLLVELEAHRAEGERVATYARQLEERVRTAEDAANAAEQTALAATNALASRAAELDQALSDAWYLERDLAVSRDVVQNLGAECQRLGDARLELEQYARHLEAEREVVLRDLAAAIQQRDQAEQELQATKARRGYRVMDRLARFVHRHRLVRWTAGLLVRPFL